MCRCWSGTWLPSRACQKKARQQEYLNLVDCTMYSGVQVLVIYLGDMRWKWLPLPALLPFQKHRQEKVAEADSLICAKRLTKPILFHKALKVTNRSPYVCTARGAWYKGFGMHASSAEAIWLCVWDSRKWTRSFVMQGERLQHLQTWLIQRLHCLFSLKFIVGKQLKQQLQFMPNCLLSQHATAQLTSHYLARCYEHC